MNRFILGLCLALILQIPVHSYTLEGQRWPLSPVAIQMNLSSTNYRLQNRRFPLQDGSASWESVYSSCAFIWNQYLAQLSFAPGQGNNSTGGGSGNSINEVFFGSSIAGQALDPNTLALTVYSYDPNTNFFIEADTVFNSNLSWDSYRGPLQNSSFDFRRVALHEMGHMLGLDHPDQAGQTVDAIMNSVVSNRDILSADDIAGGQSLYSGAVISAAGHFFGPGSDDILWRNTQTGALFIWSNHSGRLTGYPVTTLPLLWKLAGIGDFNGDGYSDLVWENTLNYNVVIWVMRGTSLVQSYTLPYGLPVVAIRSFSNNGRSDILLRDYQTGHLYLLANRGGGTFVELPVGPAVSLDRTVIGAADLYGNGGSELFWLNGPTGVISVWQVNGASVTSSANIGTLAAYWSIAGFGDFNGDRKDDVLLRNRQTGSIAAWIMSGLQIVNVFSPGAPPLTWQISAIADINDDKRKDVFLMYQPTGGLDLWYGEPTFFLQTSLGAISTSWLGTPTM
jgi:hypothetical protein